MKFSSPEKERVRKVVDITFAGDPLSASTRKVARRILYHCPLGWVFDIFDVLRRSDLRVPFRSRFREISRSKTRPSFVSRLRPYARQG